MICEIQSELIQFNDANLHRNLYRLISIYA